MKYKILNSDDYPQLEAMQTGIENDYVERIFHRLTSGNHRLYGLFLDNQMISMGGYSIFEERYAMLGRLRSDRRFRGNNYATKLIAHIINEAFQVNGIKWVGANTQEENKPARRVVEKLELTPLATLHGAVTKDLSSLESKAKPWNRITSHERKKQWLKEVYIRRTAIFPYEVYYSFPATKDLFKDEEVQKWSFYENATQNRVLITKYDQKKNHYLHAVYPWSDITSQSGLWETISNDYHELKEQTGADTYIWMDLTKEEVQLLPKNHNFELPSPWMLYGIDKVNYCKLK
ncbi:GNAT family N-acetyltransferase [Evansella sp. AB-rgal1]|uniref:GNAT family N-acetyltransferase n=1 Tax=Evansella sp. AB-rgal1 TaxID=3242696 RepID=UPI00359D9A5F